MGEGCLNDADDRLGGTAASSMFTDPTELTSSGSMLYASIRRHESACPYLERADDRRMQTSTHKSTFIQAIKEVLGQSGTSSGFAKLNSGVRGLYTGLSASIFRQMTYSITRLGAYDALKARLSQDGTFPLLT